MIHRIDPTTHSSRRPPTNLKAKTNTLDEVKFSDRKAPLVRNNDLSEAIHRAKRPKKNLHKHAQEVSRPSQAHVKFITDEWNKRKLVRKEREDAKLESCKVRRISQTISQPSSSSGTMGTSLAAYRAGDGIRPKRHGDAQYNDESNPCKKQCIPGPSLSKLDLALQRDAVAKDSAKQLPVSRMSRLSLFPNLSQLQAKERERSRSRE